LNRRKLEKESCLYNKLLSKSPRKHEDTNYQSRLQQIKELTQRRKELLDATNQSRSELMEKDRSAMNIWGTKLLIERLLSSHTAAIPKSYFKEQLIEEIQEQLDLARSYVRNIDQHLNKEYNFLLGFSRLNNSGERSSHHTRSNSYGDRRSTSRSKSRFIRSYDNQKILGEPKTKLESTMTLKMLVRSKEIESQFLNKIKTDRTVNTGASITSRLGRNYLDISKNADTKKRLLTKNIFAIELKPSQISHPRRIEEKSAIISSRKNSVDSKKSRDRTDKQLTVESGIKGESLDDEQLAKSKRRSEIKSIASKSEQVTETIRKLPRDRIAINVRIGSKKTSTISKSDQEESRDGLITDRQKTQKHSFSSKRKNKKMSDSFVSDNSLLRKSTSKKTLIERPALKDDVKRKQEVTINQSNTKRLSLNIQLTSPPEDSVVKDDSVKAPLSHVSSIISQSGDSSDHSEYGDKVDNGFMNLLHPDLLNPTTAVMIKTRPKFNLITSENQLKKMIMEKKNKGPNSLVFVPRKSTAKRLRSQESEDEAVLVKSNQNIFQNMHDIGVRFKTQLNTNIVSK